MDTDLPMNYTCEEECGMSFCSRTQCKLEALRSAYAAEQNDLGLEIEHLERKTAALVIKMAQNERQYRDARSTIEGGVRA